MRKIFLQKSEKQLNDYNFLYRLSCSFFLVYPIFSCRKNKRNSYEPDI